MLSYYFVQVHIIRSVFGIYIGLWWTHRYTNVLINKSSATTHCASIHARRPMNSTLDMSQVGQMASGKKWLERNLGEGGHPLQQQLFPHVEVNALHLDLSHLNVQLSEHLQIGHGGREHSPQRVETDVEVL